MILLKLAQIDPNEICLVRERIYAHKQRLANAQNEQAAVAAAASSAAGVFNSASLTSVKSLTNQNQQKKKSSESNSKKKQATIHEDLLEESELFNEQTNKFDRRRAALIDEIKLPGDLKKLEDALSDALYKDIWLNIAELLVENGFFQIARDYLFECLNACQVSYS